MSRNRSFDTVEGKIVWRMLLAANEVRLNAYAPYSDYLVGCAIFAVNGIFVGCNVECADYDGTHAEEAALAAMVADGVYSPGYIIVVGGLRSAENLSATPPCGKCRQKLFEFASLNNDEVMLVDLVGANSYRLIPISKLLPRAFGPADVKVDLTRYRK
ncbi:cytidine deaminase [Candidatus Uhrbacteria bacterium]|nr:cytidine deaminase [Candidatus Uhrbacteria bacterium]